MKPRNPQRPLWFTSLRRVLCGLVVAVAVAGSVSKKADHVQISNRFIGLIEQFEGFRAQCYQDTGGVWTIGYGHACPAGDPLRAATLTREQAEALLRQDVQHAVEAVNMNVTVLLKQEQFDALVDFAFNVGVNAFKNSTLLRKLNAGHCCAVPDQLRKWNRDNGQVIAGLIARRNAEIALYVGDC